MSIENAIHYYALENPPASFSGNHTVQIQRVLSSVGADATLDVPLIDGKLDRQAIIDFVGDGIAKPLKFYDLKGNINAVGTNIANAGGGKIYENGVFSEDDEGNIIIEDHSLGGNAYCLETAPSTGAFSYLIRLKVNPTTNEKSVYGSRTNPSIYGIRYEQGSTSSFYSSGLGSPSYFKNGSSFSVSNKGEAYDLISGGVWNNILVANGTMPALSANEFFLFGSNRGTVESPILFAALFDEDQSANAQTLSDELDAIYIPPDLPTGAITYPDGTIYSGVWDRYKAPAETQGVPTLIESGSIVDGAYDGVTTERDDTQVEYFVSRGLSNDFTGTISSVSGTSNVEVDISPTDLSGVSIGASSDHWVFRATDGTNADEEVTVLSRSGNVITLKSNPGFSAGDAFVLGKVIKNVSNILPKG